MRIIVCCIVLSIIYSCSSSDNDDICESSGVINLNNGVCLKFESNDLESEIQSQIISITEDILQDINNVMPISDIVIRFINNPNSIIPEIGIGGYNPSSDEIIIYYDPNRNELESSIELELAFQISHEIHHAKRRRSVGYGNTLLEALVSEGLADCFAIEVTGAPNPLWSTAVTGNDLDIWIENNRNSWNQGPYNHSDWFLGTNPQIPRWLGYSMGFKIVKDYIANNPGSLASQLHNEPATSFE